MQGPCPCVSPALPCATLCPQVPAALQPCDAEPEAGGAGLGHLRQDSGQVPVPHPALLPARKPPATPRPGRGAALPGQRYITAAPQSPSPPSPWPLGRTASLQPLRLPSCPGLALSCAVLSLWPLRPCPPLGLVQSSLLGSPWPLVTHPCSNLLMSPSYAILHIRAPSCPIAELCLAVPLDPVPAQC